MRRRWLLGLSIVALAAACGPKMHPARAPEPTAEPDDESDVNVLEERRAERERKAHGAAPEQQSEQHSNRVGSDCPKRRPACLSDPSCSVGADGCEHCQCSRSGVWGRTGKPMPDDVRNRDEGP